MECEESTILMSCQKCLSMQPQLSPGLDLLLYHHALPGVATVLNAGQVNAEPRTG